MEHIEESQSSAVEESTASINEMVASLKNVSGITLNKHQSTIQLVETTKIGGEKVSQMNKLVSAINESVGDISKMVEIINDIATDSLFIDEGAKAISILTEDLSRNALGLDMEINRFKTHR